MQTAASLIPNFQAGEAAMNTKRLRRSFWTAALIVAAILACYAIVATMPFAPKKYGDLDFHREAKNLALALKGINREPVTIIRAPGPVLFYAIPFLAVPFRCSDEAYWNAAVIWTVLCMIVSIFLIRASVQRLAGEFAANTAVVLALSTPFWAYYSFGINGEGPAFFGVALFLYGWARWRGADRWRTGDLALMWAGLALFILTKPSALGLVAIAAVCGLVLWFRKQRKEALLALSCGLILTLTSAGSSILLKHFERPDYRPAQLLYFRWTAFFGSWQMRSQPWDWRFWDDTTRAGSADYADFVNTLASLREAALRTRYSVFDLEWNWVVNDFRQHPLMRVRMALVRALSMQVNVINSLSISRFHLGPLRGWAPYLLVHAAINLCSFFILGASVVFVIRYRRGIFSDWLLWGPWVALLAFHSVFYAEARFLFPAQPGLLVMASIMISSRLARWKPHTANG